MPENNKKLLHLLTSLEIGGAERFVLELAETQAQQGMAVAVLSLGSQQEPLWAVAQQKGLVVHSLDSPSRWQRWRKLYALLKPYAVIHLHSPYSLLNLLPLLPLLGKRVIYTRHGAGEFNSRKWRLIHRLACPYVDFAGFVSEQGRTVFKRNQGWPDSKLRVIENGVPIPTPCSLLPSSCLRLGMVGRMVELKAFHHLLSAVAMLPTASQAQLEIHLFGDGPCRAGLEQQAGCELPNTYVMFHGMQSDQSKIYAAFDLLVVCSETEGLSMAIIEAMARGIPVIASNVGGSPRLVLPKQTGWLYEYADLPALARLIEQGLNQRSQWAALSEQCISHIQSQFSIQQSAAGYAQLYKESD